MTATPAGLELVRSFLNTYDADEGTDDLDDTKTFAAWLHERDRSVDRVGEDDLEVAREIRDALRELAAAHHDGTPSPSAQRALARASGALPVVVSYVDGAPQLVPHPDEPPVRRFLARVLAAVAVAGVDGTWERLKICPADDCQWAFVDTSRNRSRRWCAMEVCGNRSKTRAYRRRHET